LHVVPSGPPELELVLVVELLLVLVLVLVVELLLVLVLVLVLELLPELVLVLDVVELVLELLLMLPPAPPQLTRSPQSDESW
jgi:hypothetical protein